MARYRVTIEDAPGGRVQITSVPPAQGLIDRIRRKALDLTPCEEYMAEFFVLALKKSKAADMVGGKLILPH